MVRHRMASFAQESTRYVNYKSGIEFIIPCWLKLTEGEYNYEDANPMVTAGRDPREYGWDSSSGVWLKEGEQLIEVKTKHHENKGTKQWIMSMQEAEYAYKELINFKEWSPQQARSVLPNSLKTEINIKANLREWRHIFKLRTAKAAHPQIREVMGPLLDEFKSRIPLIFNDIEYEL